MLLDDDNLERQNNLVFDEQSEAPVDYVEGNDENQNHKVTNKFNVNKGPPKNCFMFSLIKLKKKNILPLGVETLLDTFKEEKMPLSLK